jgi:hypothetical protein
MDHVHEQARIGVERIRTGTTTEISATAFYREPVGIRREPALCRAFALANGAASNWRRSKDHIDRSSPIAHIVKRTGQVIW